MKSGLVSEGLLLGFEDGVYRVRQRGGEEADVSEDELRKVGFAPLGGPGVRPDRRPGRPERPAPPWAGSLREVIGRRQEMLRRFRELKARGTLDSEIASLENRLREARTPRQAFWTIAEIVHARRVRGDVLAEEDFKRLIDSIEDTDTRNAAATSLYLLNRVLERRAAPPGRPLWRGRRDRRPPQ
jgi:hypothetical protein